MLNQILYLQKILHTCVREIIKSEKNALGLRLKRGHEHEAGIDYNNTDSCDIIIYAAGWYVMNKIDGFMNRTRRTNTRYNECCIE